MELIVCTNLYMVDAMVPCAAASPSPEERASPATDISPEMDQRERWIEWVKVRGRDGERKKVIIADLVARRRVVAHCLPRRRSPARSLSASIIGATSKRGRRRSRGEGG